MGRSDYLNEPLLTRHHERLHITFEHRLEWRRRLPFRMLGDKRFHSIDRKDVLDVHRLLGPERAVIVESGNAPLRWHEVSGSLFGHARNEIDEGCLRGPVAPRRKRIIRHDRPPFQ